MATYYGTPAKLGWGNDEELSWDSVSSLKKGLERGAWAGPDGYTKVSQPIPWRLMSKH